MKQWDKCYYKVGTYGNPILRKGVYVATIPKENRKNDAIHIVLDYKRNVSRVRDVFPIKKIEKKVPTLKIDNKEYVVMELKRQ